jgi:hypothetical protein
VIQRLLDKIAECERLVTLTGDPDEMLKFKLLRDMWVALVNESASMPSYQLTDEIAAIEEIEAVVNEGRGDAQAANG